VGRVSGRVGSPTGHTLGVFLFALPDNVSKRLYFDIYLGFLKNYSKILPYPEIQIKICYNKNNS
jgi:hypothetical protein